MDLNHKLKMYIKEQYSERCLSRTTLGPIIVFGIDRYSAYTGWINNNIYYSVLSTRLSRIYLCFQYK
jgi:hypothetical protein